MVNVHIEYFAVLREHAGTGAEDIQTEAATARDLFNELSVRHRFPELRSMKVAINDEFSDWACPLSDGDSIAFIPPVAGG